MPEKYYECAKMNSKGKLEKFALVQAETWEKARDLYKRRYDGQDYEIFVKDLK